jgi:hypothetical protein
MVEILFGESEAGSMKYAKGKWIPGNSNEVICLAFMLDIGSISESVDSLYRNELIYSMLNQGQWGNDSELDTELKATGSIYVSELNRLKDYINNGEEVRIWYCDRPYSLCGFYFLCNWMKDDTNKINVVKLPEHIVKEDCTISYQNWGEIIPEDFSFFLKYEEQLFKEERRMYEIRWAELVHDDMPLRVIMNGQLMGVTEDFYDFLIWKKLTYEPIKQAGLIGDILGHYPVSVGDWWYALRIEEFINCGKIRVSEDSPNKYARTICLV